MARGKGVGAPAPPSSPLDGSHPATCGVGTRRVTGGGRLTSTAGFSSMVGLVHAVGLDILSKSGIRRVRSKGASSVQMHASAWMRYQRNINFL